MNLCGPLLLIGCAGIVQVSLLSRARLFGAGCDLLLAACVMAAVRLEPAQAFIMGLCAGVFKDMFDTHDFGINSVIFPLAAYFVSRLNRTLSLDNGFACFLITLACAVVMAIAAALILAYQQMPLPGGALVRMLLLDSALTAGLAGLLAELLPAKPRAV